MTVRIDVNGPVWTVILHRPHARNAVDGPTAAALTGGAVALSAGGAVGAGLNQNGLIIGLKHSF